MKRNVFLATVIFILSISISKAQTWQWAKQGGSAFNMAGSPAPPEEIYSIDVDNEGNTYISGRMENSGRLDTIDAPGGFPDEVTFLARISCTGNVDWVHYFGSPDRASGVYKFAMDNDKESIFLITNIYDSLVISGDTVIKVAHINSNFKAIIKYRTDGERRWVKEFNSTIPFVQVRDIKIDQSDKIYLYIHPPTFSSFDSLTLLPGVTIELDNYYLFKFDKDMNYISYFDMKLGNPYNINFEVSKNRIALCINFTDSLRIEDTVLLSPPISSSFAIVIYDTSGSIIDYTRTNADPLLARDYSGCTGMAINNDTVYIVFQSKKTIFNNDTFVNTLNPARYTYSAVTLPLSNIHHTYHKITGGTGRDLNYGGAGFSVYKDYIYYPVKIWDSLLLGPIKIKPNGRIDNIIIVLDKQLNFVDTLLVDANPALTTTEDLVNHICFDQNGNMLLGGEFSSKLYFSFDTLSSRGGLNDIFVAKYGSASCIPCVPNAGWNDSVSGLTLYCENTSIFSDSAYWSFGDGAHSNTLNATHSFSGTGIYTVCLYAFGSCGIDTLCKSIGVLGLNDIENTIPLSVFPNPANETTTIQFSSDEATTLSVTDISGHLLYNEVYPASSSVQTKTLDTSKLPVGMYYLQLESANKRSIAKLVVIR